MKHIVCMVILLWSKIDIKAQESEKNIYLFDNLMSQPCISDEEYKVIQNEMDQNRIKLGLNDKKNHKPTSNTILYWPLQASAALNDCDFYYISAFVDQDPTAGIKDWNCGTRTYNGHRGVDIVPWPFIWHKMDNNLTEVIAAAPGIIIAKVDGNPDRICDGVGGGANSNNYITIQHADGSTALYAHMKTGSLTSKTIGQSITVGEYLGIVGSAGQSTGVHLHFEIRTDGNFANYIDPFYGACNTGIGNTWWATQKPYTEPKIMKLSLHSQWPYMASCPNTIDTLYEQDTFVSSVGQKATFYVCTKHVLTNDVWNFKIINPDNSIFDSWNYTSTVDRNTSTLGWNKTLPTIPGVYTFEGTFKSTTCQKQFTIQAPAQVTEYNNVEKLMYVYPNPIYKELYINIPESLFDNNIRIQIFDILGRIVRDEKVPYNVSKFDIHLNKGIYYYRILNNTNYLSKGKLEVFN